MANRPLCLLSLDGGGIRGLSELVILEEIMRRIKSDLGLDYDPRPADFFDLIGGTSTGGLIALLLGRLRLTVPQARAEYVKIAKDVFSIKQFLKKSKFDGKQLEQAVKNVLRDTLGQGHEEDRMLSPDQDSCKVFVCTVPQKDVRARSGPTLFRSYNVREHATYNCTIWEASRATSAAPTYFDPIAIGDPGEQEVFVDGGLGHNNPIEHVLAEARRIFPTREVASVVSIGTGVAGVIQFPNSPKTSPLQLVYALKRLATESDTISDIVKMRFRDQPDTFFRFSVDSGLSDIELAEWERLPEVRTYTTEYMKQPAVTQDIDGAVSSIIRARSPADPDYAGPAAPAPPKAPAAAPKVFSGEDTRPQPARPVRPLLTPISIRKRVPRSVRSSASTYLTDAPPSPTQPQRQPPIRSMNSVSVLSIADVETNFAGWHERMPVSDSEDDPGAFVPFPPADMSDASTATCPSPTSTTTSTPRASFSNQSPRPLDALSSQSQGTSTVSPGSIHPASDPARKEALMPAVWMVPFNKNDTFTGRQRYMNELYEKLFNNDGKKTPMVAIYGLGGIGKTELALAYAYHSHYKVKSQTVLWIDCTRRETIENSFAAAAEALGSNGNEMGNDKTDSMLAVRMHLIDLDANDQRWLVIFDNADDIGLWTEPWKRRQFRGQIKKRMSKIWKTTSMAAGSTTETAHSSESLPECLKDYLPRDCRRGSILFTTRDRRIASSLAGQNMMYLYEPGRDSSRSILRNNLNTLSLVEENEADTDELIRRFRSHPLALVQAARYMNKNGVDVGRYMEIAHRSQLEWNNVFSEEYSFEEAFEMMALTPRPLSFSSSLSSSPSRPPLELDVVAACKRQVTTTWLTTIQHISKTDSLAFDYLCFMACLDHWGIPQQLLPPAQPPVEMTKALNTLMAYSFISIAQGKISVHRLVHRTMKNWLAASNTTVKWAELVVSRLNLLFHDYPSQSGVNRDQLRRCGDLAVSLFANRLANFENKETVNLISCLAKFYMAEKSHDEAVWFLGSVVRCYTNDTTNYGPNHATTHKWMMKLAGVYVEQDRFADASNLHIRVMLSQTRDDVDPAYRGMHISGKQQQEYDHESMLKHFYKNSKSLLGKDRHKDAIPLLEHILEASKRVHGRTHRNTLDNMQRLACVYGLVRRTVEAEKLQARAFSEYKQKLGMMDMETLRCMATLANMKLWVGRKGEAVAMAHDCLDYALRSSKNVPREIERNCREILEAVKEERKDREHREDAEDTEDTEDTDDTAGSNTKRKPARDKTRRATRDRKGKEKEERSSETVSDTASGTTTGATTNSEPKGTLRAARKPRHRQAPERRAATNQNRRPPTRNDGVKDASRPKNKNKSSNNRTSTSPNVYITNIVTYGGQP